MDTQIIVVFCLCADMLTALHHYEDRQRQMSDAEVIMLGKSRFNRRLHNIAELFLTLFLRLGETWKKLNENSIYVIDSYPIAVCDNYRIPRAEIYRLSQLIILVPSCRVERMKMKGSPSLGD